MKDFLQERLLDDDISFQEYLTLIRQVPDIAKTNNNLTKTMEGTELKCEVISRSLSYGNARTFSYKVDGEAYINLNQIPFPNCCGITIIKDVSIYDQTTKEQFLAALNGIIATLKKDDSYSKILFYTNQGSYAAKLFALYPGVLILDSFINKRSGNALIGFEIDLLNRGSATSFQIEDEDEDSDFDIDEDENTDRDGDEESQLIGTPHTQLDAYNTRRAIPQADIQCIIDRFANHTVF